MADIRRLGKERSLAGNNLKEAEMKYISEVFVAYRNMLLEIEQQALS